MKIIRELKQAALTSISAKYLYYIVQLASLSILARFFEPSEFGFVATIHVFMLFFFLLSEAGLGPALINEEKLNEKDRDGLFSFTIIVGLITGTIFCLFLNFLNYFYKSQIYTDYSFLVFIPVMLSSITTIPLSALTREKKFFSISLIDIISELVSLAVVITALEYYDPIYSLLAKYTIYSTFRFILLMLLSQDTEFGMPKPGLNLYSISKYKGFVTYQLGFNFINYFSRNLDNILIGKYIGISMLGVYEKSYSIMRYPLLLLTSAMMPAFQPVLKNYKNDTALLLETHNKAIVVLIFLGTSAGCLMYEFSHEIVKVILGEQWSDVVPVIKIYSFSIPIQVVLSSSGAFFQATNNVNIMFRSGLFSALTNVAAITAGVYAGEIAYVAVFLTFSFSINMIQCYWIMYKKIFDSTIIVFLKLALKSSVVPLLIYTLAKKLANFLLIILELEDVFVGHFFAKIPFILTYGLALIALFLFFKNKRKNGKSKIFS
ncbi:oligosaccharide flippase family protein [Vibrio cholerae]